MAWNTLLDGYPLLGRILDGNNIVSDVVSSGVLPKMYLDFLANIFPIFKFVFQAFIGSAFLLVIFFAFWTVVIAPVLRFLSMK